MSQHTSILFYAVILMVSSCQQSAGDKQAAAGNDAPVKLITLDPGHFHAALVQKTGYPGIDTTVHVYAPDGPEVAAYLNLVNQYNSRPENPTHWNEVVYKGSDFAEKMLAEKKGNVVVLSGNNRLKTDYISRSVKAGLNVLADKPMAIDKANFLKLVSTFDEAAAQKVLLYDIMTERSEITNILQKELMHMPALFGEFKDGTEKEPAVMIESIHYFSKQVSGKQLIRPDWFFDPTQQGDAIADVGTHLVDLVQWQCFPGTVLDYSKDITINSARIWPTPFTPSQFEAVTGKTGYPDFLKPYVKDSILNTHANGEMNYTIKGKHVKIIARWDYKAEEGGDSHHAIVKGSKAVLEIRQTKKENFKPVLYILPVDKKNPRVFDEAVQEAITKIVTTYPGVTVEKSGAEWKVVVPAKYDVGHEAHFGQVMERYLQYLKEGKLPDWEVPNMIAKYYTTTTALETASKK
ncbi:MAG TPA: putative oxidoreductase C-terminal domain-containing protein [Agriterribacter sp.]|nr:putative oxidoreductase C-terminal domain-containing protein [Agriterribacter sp.]